MVWPAKPWRHRWDVTQVPGRRPVCAGGVGGTQVEKHKAALRKGTQSQRSRLPEVRRESSTSQFIPTPCAGESTQGGSRPSGPTILGAVGAPRWAPPRRHLHQPLGVPAGRQARLPAIPEDHFLTLGPVPPGSVVRTRPVPPLPASPYGAQALGRAERGRERAEGAPAPGGMRPPALLGGTPPTSSVRHFLKYWFMLWVRVR